MIDRVRKVLTGPGLAGLRAVQTSVRAVMVNPRLMTTWALIIAALLMIGSVPLLVGLAVVMPILGHSSWHLYRRMVESSAPQNPPAQA